MPSFKQFHTIIQNHQNKTLMGNFMSLGVLQAMRYLIPILVLPYVSRIIGLQHFGEIAIANTFALILQICVNYSFEFMGARDIARNREDSLKVSMIVSRIISTRLILYAVSFVGICLVSLCFSAFRPLFILIIIALTSDFFSMLISEWYFQGIEKMLHITIINVISRVIYVVLIFSLIKKESDYLLYPLFNTVGYFFAALYSLVIIFLKHKRRFIIPRIKDIVDYLKSGINLFVNQVCLQSFNMFPNFVLGIICGTSITGIYDAAAKVSIAGEHSISVLNKTFFPYLSRKIEKHSMFARINLVFGIIVAILLFIFAPFIVKLLYAPEFAPATLVLRVLSIAIVFTSVISAYSTNYLLLLGEDKIVLRITVVVFVIGFSLFTVLSNCFSYVGAAVAILFMKLLLAVSFYFAAKKYKQTFQK